MPAKPRANPAADPNWQHEVPVTPEAPIGEDFVAKQQEADATEQTGIPTLPPEVKKVTTGKTPKVGDEVLVFVRSNSFDAAWYPAKVVGVERQYLRLVAFVPASVPVVFVDGATEGEGVNNWKRFE